MMPTEPSPTCPNCVTWGRTVDITETPGMLVKCPDCGRLTWPNLGVNLPAGAAAGLAAASSLANIRPNGTPSLAEILRKIDREGAIPAIPTDLPKRSRTYTSQDARAFQKRVEKRRKRKKNR